MWPTVVNLPRARTRAVIAPTPAKLRPASARERTKIVSPRGQSPALPDTHTLPPGETTLGRTRKLGRVEDDDGAAGCRFFASTEIGAVPLIPPPVAAIVPLPTAVALKVVELPGFGENVPSAGETDQVGVTATGFP